MSYELDPQGLEIRELLRSVNFKDKRVLEIGIGDGRLTQKYANEAASVIGVEPKFDELVKVRGNIDETLTGKIQFIQGTVFSLPIKSDSFDLAVLAWSF